MSFHNKQFGFTLLELLVVIAIIGVLASAVIVSMDGSRTKATNTAIIKQMDEYQRVLSLHTATRRAPNAWMGLATGNNFCRVTCFGDGPTPGSPLPTGSPDCLGNVTQGSAHNIGFAADLHTILYQSMSTLPRHQFGSFSGPAYSACVTEPGATNFSNFDGGNLDPSETGYKEHHFSLWFLLKGTNQDCVWAKRVDGNFQNEGESTLCRYTSENL